MRIIWGAFPDLDGLLRGPGVDERLTFPVGSIFRDDPPGDVAGEPDPDACLYCPRPATIICPDHVAKLCGKSACTQFHLAVQRTMCSDFVLIEEWEKALQRPSRALRIFTAIAWLVMVTFLLAFGATR